MKTDTGCIEVVCILLVLGSKALNVEFSSDNSAALVIWPPNFKMRMYVGSGQEKIHLEVMDLDTRISHLAFISWVIILYI